MHILLQELGQRLEAMFAALERGEDVAPSAGLRVEGLMEAAVLLGIADRAAIDALLEASCLEVRGQGMAAALGDDWRSFYPFPQLPLYMQRAPVVPSTRD